MLHCYCEDRYNGYLVLSLVWKEIMNQMRLTVLNKFIPKIKKGIPTQFNKHLCLWYYFL